MSDTRDPITAFLPMHMAMIADATGDHEARLNAQFALGYLQTLYDLQRIQPGTYSRLRDEIDRSKTTRLAELKNSAAELDREIRSIETDMRQERTE